MWNFNNMILKFDKCLTFNSGRLKYSIVIYEENGNEPNPIKFWTLYARPLSHLPL